MLGNEYQLLRLREVVKIVHYTKPSIYRLMAEGNFPRPIRLGGRSVFWVKSDIEAFIQDGINERTEEAT